MYEYENVHIHVYMYILVIPVVQPVEAWILWFSAWPSTCCPLPAPLWPAGGSETTDWCQSLNREKHTYMCSYANAAFKILLERRQIIIAKIQEGKNKSKGGRGEQSHTKSEKTKGWVGKYSWPPEINPDHDERHKHHVFIGLYTCTCTVPLLTDSRPEMMFNRTSGHCISWREFSSIIFIHHKIQKILIHIYMFTSSFNWTRNSGRRCSIVLQGGERGEGSFIGLVFNIHHAGVKMWLLLRV